MTEDRKMNYVARIEREFEKRTNPEDKAEHPIRSDARISVAEAMAIKMCINELDIRLQKLEREKGIDPLLCGKDPFFADLRGKPAWEPYTKEEKEHVKSLKPSQQTPKE